MLSKVLNNELTEGFIIPTLTYLLLIINEWVMKKNSSLLILLTVHHPNLLLIINERVMKNYSSLPILLTVLNNTHLLGPPESFTSESNALY